jgi:D-3-phosphoglycerate dehydrogenase
MHNDDRPGVVGGVGMALARQGVNIATFALGRGDAGAVSVAGVDDGGGLEDALEEIRGLPNVKEVRVVRLA